ncbi:hypothetical protein [Xenophilus sp. Marseille-Q4582]|nr:hypothetical protein [Xenophilus sp. Marseille-Q4582]
MTDVNTVEEQPVAKLVDWSNPPNLSDLKADLQGAKSHHNAKVAQIDE